MFEQYKKHFQESIPRIPGANVQMRGQYYYFDDVKDVKIPARMAYHFRS